MPEPQDRIGVLSLEYIMRIQESIMILNTRWIYLSALAPSQGLTKLHIYAPRQGLGAAGSPIPQLRYAQIAGIYIGLQPHGLPVFYLYVDILAVAGTQPMG